MKDKQLRNTIDKIIVDACNETIEIGKIDKNAGKVLHMPKATDKVLSAIKKVYRDREKLNKNKYCNCYSPASRNLDGKGDCQNCKKPIKQGDKI